VALAAMLFSYSGVGSPDLEACFSAEEAVPLCFFSFRFLLEERFRRVPLHNPLFFAFFTPIPPEESGITIPGLTPLFSLLFFSISLADFDFPDW